MHCVERPPFEVQASCDRGGNVGAESTELRRPHGDLPSWRSLQKDAASAGEEFKVLAAPPSDQVKDDLQAPTQGPPGGDTTRSGSDPGSGIHPGRCQQAAQAQTTCLQQQTWTDE
ncbi:hypothetical protein NDU88_004088 [Pleurodeles waltl]|uniref:Uncharacterized protein n=1 Tax=Pleurodeles waltl TaxID=8319 RepID=A0AAV7MTV9_PLEWA|nr:hypothetical protein NDU88_004088 [Pleurodeles waltl]